MKDKLWIGIVIILASLILGISFIIGANMVTKTIKAKEIVIADKSLNKIAEAIQSLKQGAEAPQPKMPEPGERRVEGVTAGTSPIKGKANAQVLLVEFSDFQCPYSKMFYKEAFPQIEKEYISTGKVKFAYRDYPLDFHPLAKGAAIASRCAGKQNKFWEMFDKLTHNNALEAENIKKYVQEIGLTAKAFEACLSDQNIAKEVEKDTQEAAQFGVQGTPAFFINGRFVEGAYPFEAFKKIIEEELTKR